MRGKAGLMITVLIAAIGVKVLTFLASGYISQADPQGSFSSTISGFLGIADIIFYGLLAIFILLIPYYLSRRGKKKQQEAPQQPPSQPQN